MTKQGSVFGGTLLITGSCIGAGMLALPISTGIGGFFPSSFLFFIAWLFMTTTALFLVEVLGWYEKPVNLLTMVSDTLGSFGKVLCWFLYLFLFYALLVAYISLSGKHVASFTGLPASGASLFFVIFFGWIVYLGTKPVDHFNRFLMAIKIGAFLVLISLGLYYITPNLLSHWQTKYTLFSFPILIISFGFHNVVPSLMRYMGGDRRRVRQAIFAGSLFTMFIYLIWEVVALGVLPPEVILKNYRLDNDAAKALTNYLGSGAIGYSANILAFFAILTSFLAQALTLAHFLGDGFKLSQKKREGALMCLLALGPPLVFSLFFPNLFFKALDFAGGICAVVLFGIFPALMVWIGRYKQKNLLADRVLGGKTLLVVILFVACFIFFYQITQMAGLSLFPKPV